MVRRTIAAWVLAAGAATGAWAADAPQPQLYLIHQETPKIDRLGEYESTSRDFLRFLDAHRTAIPHLRFITFETEEHEFLFVGEIPNLAGVDAINQDFGAVVQGPDGAQFQDLYSKGMATVEKVVEWVVEEEPALSYRPATPRLKPEEAVVARYAVYHIQPGKEQEAEAVLQEIAALAKSKSLADGYTVYKTVLGQDTPTYAVRVDGRSPSDLHTAREKNAAQLGEGVEKSITHLRSLCRKYEVFYTQVRPDLSLLRRAGE
ncbi:MAG TPA: hypothetical protein PK413_00415 [Thermoanaerobaculia bacterium]|nr:hypothetical protein [Thermoanaerobaculia bacterium]